MAALMCKGANIDFYEQFQHFSKEGYILSTPNSVIFAEPTNDPVEGWFIFLAFGENCFKLWYKQMPFRLPNVIFYRSLKRKRQIIIPMDRFERYLNVTTVKI